MVSKRTTQEERFAFQAVNNMNDREKYHASRWTDGQYRVYRTKGDEKICLTTFDTWDAAHSFASLANLIEEKLNVSKVVH